MDGGDWYPFVVGGNVMLSAGNRERKSLKELRLVVLF